MGRVRLERREEEVNCRYFLPVSLIRLMEFKEVECGIFRPKWRQKKRLAIKSETFSLNPKIVKNPLYFFRYFPKLCELVPYKKFTNQIIDLQKPVVNYKVGGVFSVRDPSSEYLIKLNIQPDMTCVIQLLGQDVSVTENLLHNLVFTLG